MAIFNRLLVGVLPMVPRPLVGRVAARYVAGSTLDQAITKVRELNARGAMATLDLLGEEEHDPARAEASAAECVRILDAIATTGVDSNLSIKLTMFGLKADVGLCKRLVERIVAAGRERNLFVRIDMEDATTTDVTLELYRDFQARYGNVGCVLQAYMRRTLSDIAALPTAGLVNVRICKGIYIEPRAIAWKGYDTVRQAYVAALEKLLAQGVYTAIATHDEYLVAAACDLLDRHRVPPERYEFQMLLGVDEPLRDILIAQGHRLRVYVPYGQEWYAYSLRRLRENPEIAGHVTRAFFARR